MPEKTVTVARPFVARERETTLLRGLVSDEREAARVVVGEPGIGRTALLRHLADTSPHRVVWVRGTRGEAELPYSAATVLLTELAAYFPAVPVVQRRALEIALALADGPRPTTLAVCLGALGVLRAAARDESLLVLVDDLQWVDPESRRLLVFLGRRLTRERVALVMAQRDEPGELDLPVLRLEGLDLADCQRLVRAHGLLAPDYEVAEVVDVAGGNPLAVVETLAGPRTGDLAVDVGTAVLPAWRDVLAPLPDRTREALAVLAAGAVPVEAVLRELGLSLRDLAPAERLDLVTGDLRLRHRLLGPVVLAAASVALRKEVGLAVTGPDEALEPEARAERLLGAATAAIRAGQGGRAVALAREAAALTTDPEKVAAAVTQGARALELGGQYRHAHDELAAAAARLAREAPVVAAGLLCEAALSAMVMGAAGLACAAICEAELLAEGTPLPARARLLADAARAMHGLPAGMPESAEPLVTAAQAHLWAERFEPARAALAHAVGERALTIRADLEYRTGQWGAAFADAVAAVNAAVTPSVACGLFVLARLAAARGDEATGPLLSRARVAAGPFGVDLLPDPAIRGLAALTAGEPGAAIEPLEAAWTHAVEAGVWHPNVVPFAADLAEAHARCGDPDRAREIAAWLTERAGTLTLRAPLAAAWRCRGLLATDADAAADAFAAAHRAGDRQPFEHARTLLCEGEVLRRLRRPALARSPLRRAAEVFEGLGATVWARRAGAELSAAGDRDAASAGPADTGLTPQQLRIANMVAAGHNNVETAQALFLSRKTVEAHLTQAYRKLGVHSRTQLVRALASLEGARGPGTAAGGA